MPEPLRSVCHMEAGSTVNKRMLRFALLTDNLRIDDAHQLVTIF